MKNVKELKSCHENIIISNAYCHYLIANFTNKNSRQFKIFMCLSRDNLGLGKNLGKQKIILNAYVSLFN